MKNKSEFFIKRYNYSNNYSRMHFACQDFVTFSQIIS